MSRRVITQPAGFQILLLLILRMYEVVVEGLVTVMRTGTWIGAVDRGVEASANC